MVRHLETKIKQFKLNKKHLPYDFIGSLLKGVICMYWLIGSMISPFAPKVLVYLLLNFISPDIP
jgi:hypothetical protein